MGLNSCLLLRMYNKILGFFNTRAYKCSRHYGADKSTVRIALIEDDVYLVQGSKHVSEVFRTSTLTVTKAYAIALKYCFGMASKSVKAYLADTSGSHSKPIPGSSVDSRGRVSYHTHENLVRGLLGKGLASKTDRFEQVITESLSSLEIDEEWVEFPDLLGLFQNVVGSAVLKSIFGDHLLSQNPTFLDDLWEYDGTAVMNLARRLPSFITPRAYKLRASLLSSITRWYKFVESKAEDSDIDANDEIDPFWGSAMMRERQDMLLKIKDQDRNSVASTDLGFIWA